MSHPAFHRPQPTCSKIDPARRHCFSLTACIWVSLLAIGTAQADNGTLIRPNGYSIDSPVSPASNSTASSSNASPGNLHAKISASHNATQDSLSIPLRQRTSDPELKSPSAGLTSLGGSLGTTIGALIVTLGLFAILVIALKRFQKQQLPRALPREAFEVIGETEIGPKQKLLVVRCGVQALVIGVSSAGIQNVAQIDDPDEAGQFIAQCRGLGSTTMFNETLKELEREPSPRGFVAPDPEHRPKGKLFLRA